MNTQPSKLWAYVAIFIGALLVPSGLAATIGYFSIPVSYNFDDLLSYELGNIAALYLGLVCGTLAIIHGIASVAKRKSTPFKLPRFYIFWIVLALVLGLGALILENNIAVDYLFPPLFILGAALSTMAVLGWAYQKMGFPITWRQASLAFVCGSTLAVFVAIILETSLPYLGYLLLEPAWYIAESFADLAWGTPGFIERFFASPLILVFLAVVAIEAPIPEEFAKALSIPFFGRGRIKNERQAFAIGLASGAGFAILENMLYEGLYAYYNGWNWAGITLLRSIGSVLHPIGTGIIALGWFRMKDGNFGKLIKAYLLSVGLHTLWNGGFEPLLYITGLEYFAGDGPSLSLYGETLSALLVGYLVLLSLGLWWLLQRIVNQISEHVTLEIESVPVSRRFIATWAVACVMVLVPIGATLSPAWSAIRLLITEGKITQVELPEVGTREEAIEAFTKNRANLDDLSSRQSEIPEIIQPGDVYTSTVNLNPSQTVLWPYTWCTTTSAILNDNFSHIQIEFVIDDAVVSEDKIAASDYPQNSNDGVCRQYYAVINHWPVGRHHLEIRVTFTQDINDGWDTYPTGTHTYEHIVTVKR